VPTWPLFNRLVLNADDRAARSEAEAQAEKEVWAIFGDADTVEMTDKGQGCVEFSAKLDRTKKSDPTQ
jgi:hypothetical protein